MWSSLHAGERMIAKTWIHMELQLQALGVNEEGAVLLYLWAAMASMIYVH